MMTMKSAVFASSAFLCGLELIINSASADEDAKKCSLYLAKSTIENAGLGVFTGIPLEEGADVGFGDPSIPIIDIDFHAGGSKLKEDYHWLLSEYVWSARSVGPEMELEAEDTSAFVTGQGSMPNCHFRLRNIAETKMECDTAGITRADAGIGAFTPYHSRFTYTVESVEAGSELFVDYGNTWFLSREEDMGLVLPSMESYRIANKFVSEFDNLYEKIELMTKDYKEEVEESILGEAMEDLWDIIKQSPYKSRPLSAVPKSFSVANRAFDVGIEQTELEQSILPLEYLDMHGKCLDNIRPGNSTIPQAGRGAFATRTIQKGRSVSIAPLIHIPDRHILNMYAETGEEARDSSKPIIGHQLLLNYCFGNKLSSMLLCLYGSGTPFINHNSDSPNAKIVWSDDPTYHKAEWMDEPVAYFDNVWSAGLSFEYIATRDINEGDEIFIDYGTEWEEAWMNHVQQWQHAQGAAHHINAKDLTQDPSLPIPTYQEANNLIGESIVAWCHYSSRSIEEDSHVWREPHDWQDEYTVQRIIDRIQDPSDESYVYALELQVDGDGDEPISYLVKNVPRGALSFYEGNYRSNIFMEGVFRHEMVIPDEIFPDAWKNIIP